MFTDYLLARVADSYKTVYFLPADRALAEFFINALNLLSVFTLQREKITSVGAKNQGKTISSKTC